MSEVCKCCHKPPGPVSDHRLDLGYCYPCYLVNVEKRAPAGSCGHRPPLAGQYKFNPDTLDASIVASGASDRPVKEKQGNLLDWAEETRKLDQWKQASKQSSEEKGGD